MPASPLALFVMLTGRLLPSLTSEIIDFRLRRMSGTLTQANYVNVVPKKQHGNYESSLFTTGKLHAKYSVDQQ